MSKAVSIECYIFTFKAAELCSIAKANLAYLWWRANNDFICTHVYVFGCKGAEGHTHYAMKKPKITSLSSCRIKFRQKASENTCRETRTAFIAALYCYTKVYIHSSIYPRCFNFSTTKKVLRNLRERLALVKSHSDEWAV